MAGTGDLQSSNKNFFEYCQEIRETIRPDKKILLVNPPQFNFNSFEPEVAKSRCYYAYPPVGLQCLAAALEGRGLEIRILDSNYEFLKRVQDDSINPENWLSIFDDYLKEYNPSVIGISNFFVSDYPAFMQISNHLRKKDRILIAGGQNATYNSESLVKKEVCDFVCERESENKINFLFDNLFENNNHIQTPGIVFKYHGKVERTTGEKDIVKLNGNLISSSRLIPLEKYCRVGSLSPYSRMAGKDIPFSTFLLNRGCAAGCQFCDVVDYMGRGVRSRQVNDVLDEIEGISAKGIKFFELLDDDFGAYRNKALALVQGIKDRNIKISWSSNNGIIAKTLDETLLEKMRDSGCTGFKIGIESGNPERLKKIKKPGTLESFREFSRISQKFPEMFIADNYIFGFPEETFKEILDSYKFSLEMNLDWSSYTVYQHNVRLFGTEDRINQVGDFMPAKDILKGRLSSDSKIYEGMEVFNISPDEVPKKEQLNSIWFSFNLIRNFIQNKNLTPSGNIDKFISWVSVIQERYPTHPYISLPLSLALMIDGNSQQSERYHQKAVESLDDYWAQKLNKFSLTEILNDFPKNSSQAKEVLSELRKKTNII